MWVFTQGGLLSAVEHKGDKDLVCVRARRKEHLQYHFPLLDPIHKPDADYHWRVVVPKDHFATVVAAAAMDIDYSNFKESLSDELYQVYTNVWAAALRLQPTKVWNL